MANLRRLPSYRQHATVGLLKNSDFPQAIMKNYHEDWKQKLANEFITCAALLNSKVSVMLESDELTLWELKFNCSEGGCNVGLRFSKSEMKIVSSKAFSNGLKNKLSDFSRLKFDMESFSVFSYVHVLFSSLESTNSIINLRQSLKTKVQNMSVMNM